MRLKYTLNNDIEGEHITTYSPKGWQETELVLKRHDKYDGIFLDYTVKVEFFCGAGKEYVDNIYDTQGIEALVTCTIEMDCDDSGEFVSMYEGQLIMKSYEKIQAAPEYTRINLEQVGIIQTVLNRLETKIDITKTETLDGDPVIALTYAPYDLNTHSKEIVSNGRVEMLSGVYSENYVPVATTETLYFVLPFDTISFEEFGNFETPIAPLFTSIGGSPNIQACYFNAGATTLTVDFDYSFIGNFQEFFNRNRNYTLNLVYRVNNSNDPTIVGATSLQLYGFKSALASVNINQAINEVGTLTGLSIPPGYGLYFYFVLVNYSGQSLVSPSTTTITLTMSEMSVTGRINSTTDPTVTKAFAVFETGADIARKITGQADAFRSNYFGRTNSEPFAYDANGCGSFSAFTNGFLLRGFPLAERPLTMSMKEYYDGLNAIHCLGLGVKQEDDNTFIEIEPKEYFYRNDEVVLTLNNIRGLITKIDLRYFFSRFTVGYNNWRKEGLNGLDEFCTTHNYATLLKSVNQELIATSDLIAAPYALERQRRQQYIDTATTDEDYDNNNFIIALNRSEVYGVPTGLDTAEKDENFTNIDNVLSPSTIYNLRFSPARIARNWFKILATSLIKLNDTLKTVKFTFAEGNKTMTSEGTETCDPANENLVDEGEDLTIEVPSLGGDRFNPIFTGEIDTIENYPLSFASYTHLKSLDTNGVPNFYKMIRYSLGESDYLFGFIEEIRYNPVIGKASFTLRRAYVTDVDCTHIYVEAGYVECGFVE